MSIQSSALAATLLGQRRTNSNCFKFWQLNQSSVYGSLFDECVTFLFVSHACKQRHNLKCCNKCLWVRKCFSDRSIPYCFIIIRYFWIKRNEKTETARRIFKAPKNNVPSQSNTTLILPHPNTDISLLCHNVLLPNSELIINTEQKLLNRLVCKQHEKKKNMHVSSPRWKLMSENQCEAGAQTKLKGDN